MEEYSPEQAEAILQDTIDQCMEITGSRIEKEIDSIFDNLKSSIAVWTIDPEEYRKSKIDKINEIQTNSHLNDQQIQSEIGKL